MSGQWVIGSDTERKQITEVRKAMARMNRLWTSGQAASPSDRDFADAAREVIPGDVPDEAVEAAADACYALSCDGASPTEQAAFLVGYLTAAARAS